MKKIAIILALMLIQTQITAVAAYNKKPAQKTAVKTSTQNVQKPADTESTYLLKYNIDDLEAAPWLNNGQRIYKK